jgi:hypothetical protein
MKAKYSDIIHNFPIGFFLPDGMSDRFEAVKAVEEPDTGSASVDVLFGSFLHIYLDGRDARTGEQLCFKPNGFTEAAVIKDYPVRNRKVLLHVRRRRYPDAVGRSIIPNQYPLTADGTKVSVEFGVLLKMVMDNQPVTENASGRYFHIKGSGIERYCKHHLSD